MRIPPLPLLSLANSTQSIAFVSHHSLLATAVQQTLLSHLRLSLPTKPMGDSQIIPVDDDIAHNDQELARMVEESVWIVSYRVISCLANNDTQINEQVILDPNEIVPDEKVGENFEMVDSSVRAVLVKKCSARGAVRVNAPSMPNVVTGPDEKGWVIVVIRRGQTCMLLLTPTVRYFRRV